MKRLLIVLLATLVLSIGIVSAQSTTTVGAITTAASPVFAAWQPFHGGVMMWWSDTKQIWVFINNGPVVVYPDPWSEGMPNPTSTACPVPVIRGFGMIWSALGGATSALGCPYAPELGYDTAGRVLSGNSIIIDGPGETVYSVMNLLPGSSVGTWQVLRMF